MDTKSTKMEKFWEELYHKEWEAGREAMYGGLATGVIMGFFLGLVLSDLI